METMDAFANKIAIVVGASSGIGRALSEQLAGRGATVILAARREELLQEAADQINQAGGKAEASRLDVTDFEAVKTFVEDIFSRYGRLDYLFNNAGISVSGEAYLFSYDDWHSVIDVNLLGVVRGVAAAYPLMVKQGFGHIVNTSSGAGLFPVPRYISYTTSKYGVVGLSNALRIEAAPYNVKVSVACPGGVHTPIYSSAKILDMNPDRNKLDRYIALVCMSPEKCAKRILRGVERNKAIIMDSLLAYTYWILQRISPALTRWLLGIFFRAWYGFIRKTMCS